MRLIVTRPAAQAQDWIARLHALGVDAVALPLIGIEALADQAPVVAAWAQLPAAALAMFVSANAVVHFFDARPAALRWPPATVAGSTGPGTSAALRAAGVPAACIVEPDASGPFDSEALWRQVRDWPWTGRRALVVRGEDGRDWLAEQLRLAGAEVAFVAAYRRVAPVISGAQAGLVQAALADPAAHCWHFSSSEAIGHLAHALPAADWSRSTALATHPRIAETARRLGFGQVSLVGVLLEDVVARLARIALAPGPLTGPAG